MTEPLKPRIDFDGPLEVEKAQILKSARAFDGSSLPRGTTRRTQNRARSIACRSL